MLETMISVLAIVCSGAVAAMGVYRWRRAHGLKAGIYLSVGVFAGLVALMNLSALLAADLSFVRTATLAYLGFATAILLPAARAFGDLTYRAPDPDETEDRAV